MLLGGAFVCVSASAAAEKIEWRPVPLAVLKMDGRPVKLWNVYVAHKKEHLVLVQLGQRFLMLDTDLREVVEIAPAALKRKGSTLEWEAKEDSNARAQRNAERKSEKVLLSEEWSIREAGPARIIRVRLAAEGRVLEVQLPIRPDLRVLY